MAIIALILWMHDDAALQCTLLDLARQSGFFIVMIPVRHAVSDQTSEWMFLRSHGDLWKSQINAVRSCTYVYIPETAFVHSGGRTFPSAHLRL
jgi:hypothetical protein